MNNDDLDLTKSSPTTDNINKKLQELNLTPIIEYSKKISQFTRGANPVNAPLFIQDFLMAFDITNLLLTKVIRFDIDAKSQLDMQESIAYLDRAGDYLASKNIKDSSEARKRYVEIDPDVLKAKELKAKTTAMVEFLNNKLQTFRLAHDSIKKTAYSEGGDMNK
jgi:hypothetical protein